MCYILFLIIFVHFIVLGSTSAVEAQDPDTLQLTITGGDNQTTMAGRRFDEPFSVQLTDGQGVPFPGAEISFSNNHCLEPAIGQGCPPGGAWGRYETGLTTALVYTDTQGIAVSPFYIAGDTPSSGNSIIVWPLSNQSSYNFTFSQAWGAHQLIYFRQSGAPTPVPMLTPVTSFILMISMLLLGIRAQKRKRIG